MKVIKVYGTDVAGVEVPADMQGRSLVPLLKSESPDEWRKSHYYHYYEFLNDLQTPHIVRRHYGVRTDRYKLIHFYNIDEWEFYDLEADPKEMTNVYAKPQYADLVKDLMTQVKGHQEELKVPDGTGSAEANPPSIQKNFQLKPRKQNPRK